ncbi:sensor histidine kinase [Plantactinospora endophytica]|uniref:histidine kinase n=1 Tax=Plantactinospora endophytica TaxID=673535 RepID=A0ABQ4E1S4_9ACTN|nr:histidine kinase [Plantactinospora endophytica]GIG88653.1 two-component sensor histidine kinase [Plantactinospora endophytica]
MALTGTDCGVGAAVPRPPRLAVLGSTIAIGLLVGTVLWSMVVSGPVPHLRLDVLAAVLACALVPVAMTWPVAGGLALAALAAVSPVATPAATFAAINAARQRRFPVAVAVALAGVAGHAVQGRLRPFAGLSYGWWLLLMAAAYAALLGWGTWARARQALVISLRERAHRAEAEQGRRVAEARIAERTRIAQEMHDVLAHRLSLLAVYAGALEYRPDSSPQRLAEAAGVIRGGVHQALEELREVVTVLRREEPGPDPDSPPGPELRDVPRLVSEAREAGLTVSFEDGTDGGIEEAAVAPVTGRTAYRVVQEALTNARKHAAGQPVRVRLSGAPGGTLAVDVRNPLSYELPELPGAGVGLVGLTERLSLAGGRLDHAVDAAGEFHLRAELPWRT